MSTRRSNQDKMLKRFGKMAEAYQDKIARQQEIIGRLTKALTIAQQGLYEIENDSPTVRAARQTAKNTSAEMASALEVKETEQNV